jgi:uncharacterized membrane protein
VKEGVSFFANFSASSTPQTWLTFRASDKVSYAVSVKNNENQNKSFKFEMNFRVKGLLLYKPGSK